MYLPKTKQQEKLCMCKITCLVSTSDNQGLSNIKQLTNNSNEANQWCTIAMITIYHFTINAKEASQWSMSIYHQCNNINTRSNALANLSVALKTQ